MNDLLRLSESDIENTQNEKLRAMLEMCSRGHPYYMNKWRESGVDISSINSLSDLESLPLTQKHALMEDPESFRLKLPDLHLHERVLWDVGYTTGSTGDPTPVYNTSHDYYAYLFQSKRVADISGIRSDDIIANLFPLTAAPMGAFVRSATNAYAVGAAIFAALPGAPHGNFDVNRSLDEAVALIELHRATILWGIPSFVRRVLMRAVEINADFRAVRMCALTGEATSKPFREDLRHHLRQLKSAGTTMFDRYGSTEMGAFAHCVEDGPWHNPAPEIQFHEVVDPETGKRLPDGERGALGGGRRAQTESRTEG
jgi:phenylacetate-coenzyme A ligase PaaK-like adenylate-forming protein